MARDLQNQANVVAPDGDYPSGRIKNDSGIGDGTPVTENVYGDQHQFFAKLLRDANINPNDLAENTTNGFQLNQALQLNQGLSFFITKNSGPSGNIGNWVRIYTMEFDVSFESQRISFDCYSMRNNGSRTRAISVDVNYKATELPFVTFDQKRDLGVYINKSSGYSDGDLRMVVVDDSTTRKQIDVFVRFKYNEEQFRVITRSNISTNNKQLLQRVDESILSSLPAGIEMQFGWNSVGVSFQSGFSTGTRPFEYLENGDHILLRGTVNNSNTATGVGDVLTFPVLSDLTEGIIGTVGYGVSGLGGPNMRTTRYSTTSEVLTVHLAGGDSFGADLIFFDGIRIDK